MTNRVGTRYSVFINIDVNDFVFKDNTSYVNADIAVDISAVQGE